MLAGGRPFPEKRHQGTGAVFRSGIPGLLYLTGFKLRRRFSETAREPCQVKDPQRRPDEAKRQGRRFEVYPQHADRDGTNERQQKIVEPIFPRFVQPLRRQKWLYTERLTNVNATSAPKLISAVAVTRSKYRADSATIPTIMTFRAGVRHFGCT